MTDVVIFVVVLRISSRLEISTILTMPRSMVLMQLSVFFLFCVIVMHGIL